MSIAIDTNTINIPKRKERSEIVVSIEFTDRQRGLIERAVSYTIRSNAPKLFATTVDNNSFWSIRSNAVHRSMNEMANGWRNFFKMDIDTAQSLADAVTDFSNENLGDDRGDRMVATRIVNTINNEIDYQINNNETAYINQVLSIKNLASSDFTPIDYHIEVKASNHEFRMNAHKNGDNWYSLATAYINCTPTIDESGEMVMSFLVNTSGWLSDSGESFTNLTDAKIEAEYLIAEQISDRESNQVREIAEAKEIVKAMGFIAA